MMKLFKPGGAVSVFLVIILVPCLVVCFLFIDLSRIELSKSSVQSTADVTLNSLMANYDTLLCDYYGFVASVQNIDEFYDKSEEFFAKTLQANGISDDASNEIVSWIFNTVMSGGGDFSDLIQVSLEDGTSIMSAASNSGLGENPVLIKEGIVEFMKYRAPEMAIESVYKKLTEDGAELQRDLEHASDDAKLSEKRDEFAEAEGELSKKEFFTYYYYVQYTKLGLTKDDLQDAADRGNNSYVTYEQICRDSAAKYWIQKEGFPGTLSLDKISYTRSGVTKDDDLTYYKASGLSTGNIEKSKKDVATRKEAPESDDSESEESTEESTPADSDYTYYISSNDYKTARDNVLSYITGLKNALTNADTAVADYKDKDYGDGAGQTNKEQWFYFAHNAVAPEVTKVNSAGSDLAKKLIILKAVMDCTAEPDDSGFPTNWTAEGQRAINQAQDMLDGIFGSNPSGYSDSEGNKYGYDYLAVKNHVRSIRDSVQSSCSYGPATTELNRVAAELTASRAKIQEALTALRVVIYGDSSKKVVSLDKIADLADDYELDFLAWEAQAKDTETTLGDSQEEEAAGYRDKKRNVTREDIMEFKRRLTNVETLLQDTINVLDSLKFGSKKVMDISNYDTFYDQFKGAFTKPSAPMTNTDIDNAGKSAMESKFRPDDSGRKSGGSFFDLSKLSYTDYKLILVEKDDKYYDSLIAQYENIKDLDAALNGVEGEEAVLDDYEGQQDGAETDNQDEKEGNDVALGADVNNSECSGGAFGVDDIITGFANTISSLVTFGPGTRDTLYSTLYAMNMFSYRTYVYEGKRKMYYENNPGADKLTYNTCLTEYNNLNGAWAEEDPVVTTLNKSLTNRMINSSNNMANNAEIEYILFGGTNKSNLASAYGGIYALRYALNLASGFVNFYSPAAGKESLTSAAIQGVADAIVLATSGIIPAPVTKCVLIALLTALETVCDMSILLRGLPLPVYKMESSDWTCSFPEYDGDSTSADKDDDKPLSEDGFCMTYSDYLFVFLFCAFSGNGANKMYQRVGRLVECNMQLGTSNDSYDLKKAKTMFTFQSNLKVEPLMLDLPMASEYTGDLGDGAWNTYYLEMSRGY